MFVAAHYPEGICEEGRKSNIEQGGGGELLISYVVGLRGEGVERNTMARVKTPLSPYATYYDGGKVENGRDLLRNL